MSAQTTIAWIKKFQPYVNRLVNNVIKISWFVLDQLTGYSIGHFETPDSSNVRQTQQPKLYFMRRCDDFNLLSRQNELPSQSALEELA